MKYYQLDEIISEKAKHYFGDIEIIGNIDIKSNLTISGNILCHGDIRLSGFLKVSRRIKCLKNIICDDYIEVGKSIDADGNIESSEWIESGDFIKAGDSIKADEWILSRDKIKAENDIISGKHITTLGKEIYAKNIEADIIHFHSKFSRVRKYWASKKEFFRYKDIIMDYSNCLVGIKKNILSISSKEEILKIIENSELNDFEKLSLKLYIVGNEKE